LEKETPTKKRLERGKRKGKKQILESISERQNKEDFAHSIQERARAWLGLSIFSRSLSDFHPLGPSQSRKRMQL